MDLVRVQVEILYPGCEIIGQTNVPMYLNPPRPFLLRPRLKWKLGKTMDTIVVQEQAARLHFQSIGTAMDMVTLGNLDFLLTLKTEEQLFGPWIDQLVDLAMKEGDEAEKYYIKWYKIAGFDADLENVAAHFAGWFPEGEKLRLLLCPGGANLNLK